MKRESFGLSFYFLQVITITEVINNHTKFRFTQWNFYGLQRTGQCLQDSQVVSVGGTHPEDQQ